MQVSVVSKSGVPDAAILSIRAGNVKRQASSSSEKPFNFKRGDAKDNLLKFDILQCIGTGYIVLKPFEDRYRVALSGESDAEMSYEIDVKHVGPDTPQAGADRQPEVTKPSSAFSVQDAQSYLDDNGVMPFIQGMLQILVKERPKDPYNFMKRHMMNGYEPEIRQPTPPVQPARRPVEEQAPEANAKSAPPEQQADGGGQDVDELRDQAKKLLVQSFQDGSLEQSLAASHNQNQVEPDGLNDLRMQAKELLIQGFHDGSLEKSLAAACPKEDEGEDGGKEEATEEAAEAAEGVSPVSPTKAATAAIGVPAAAIAAAGGLFAAAATEDGAEEQKGAEESKEEEKPAEPEEGAEEQKSAEEANAEEKPAEPEEGTEKPAEPEEGAEEQKSAEETKEEKAAEQEENPAGQAEEEKKPTEEADKPSDEASKANEETGGEEKPANWPTLEEEH